MEKRVAVEDFDNPAKWSENKLQELSRLRQNYRMTESAGGEKWMRRKSPLQSD